MSMSTFFVHHFQVEIPFTQKLCKPLSDEGYETTLQNLLDYAIPDLVKGLTHILKDTVKHVLSDHPFR